MDKTAALSSLSVPEGTYNRWTGQKRFKEVHQQLGTLGTKYMSEALLMLREVNYALVVNLEAKMLTKLIDEIKNGEPIFAKTNLGREIYAKLASEMSTKAEIRSVTTWEQFFLQGGENPPQITQGDIIEGDIVEAKVSEAEESAES